MECMHGTNWVIQRPERGSRSMHRTCRYPTQHHWNRWEIYKKNVPPPINIGRDRLNLESVENCGTQHIQWRENQHIYGTVCCLCTAKHTIQNILTESRIQSTRMYVLCIVYCVFALSIHSALHKCFLYLFIFVFRVCDWSRISLVRSQREHP